MKRSTKKKMRRALGLSMAVAMTMTSVPEGKLFDWKGIQIQAADTAKTIDASTVVQQVESATSNTPGIPDGVLLKELKRLVNTSLNRPVDNEITFKELLSYEGEIDLSAIGNQITSISGLGYARKAKKIVLTNVPVKAIDDYEFDGCTGLQEIVLPAGLEKIGKNAFRNCNSLSTIVLPETMKTIGESAFDACTSIENINLPNSIETIEKGAFGGCKGLKEAVITNPKIVLGASVFESCENLESVSLPEGITEIPTSFFAQTGITSFKVPSTVKVIKQSAFNNAYRLSEIDLTGCTGLTTLESSAFSLSAIESIKLPNSLTTIKSNCFDSCRGLKEITIPDSVQGKGDGTGTGIETLAFWRCYSLEKVSLPSGLSVLQNGLFTSCWNLKEVEIRNSANSVLETIGSGAFSACHSLSNTDFLKELRNLKRIEDGAFAYSKFTKEEEEVEFFEYTGTRCKLKEKDIYGDAIYSLGLRSVLIPDSVTYLGNEIFAGQPNIEKVTLGNGIKSIPDKTFKECSFLKELTLPLQLKTIGNNAFSGCSRLQDVTLPTTLETIGDEAFSDCGVVKTAQSLYCDVRYIPSDAVYDSRPAGNTTATECLLYQKDENGNQDISMKFVEKDKCLTESAYKKVENPSAYRKCAIIAEKKYAKTENITTVKGTGTNAYTAYTYDASQKRVVGYQVLYTDKKNDAFSADNAVNVPTGGYTEFLVRSGTSGTRLNEKMYFGMSNLVIPNSVKTIGKKAFYNCYNLKNITISNQVIEIPESAFAVSDGNLLRVYDWVDNAYESVNYNFETNTFESRKYICDRLVTLPNSLEIIGDKAFQNNGNMKLSSADLPDTLLTIGKSAFADCHSLTSVVIPSKVKTIGDSAFWGCSEYEKAKVKGPGKYDVYYVDEKSGLKDLNLTQAASLETVGTNAFGLTPIVQCTLPEKVTVVPNGLFSYCEYLTKVVCSNNTTEVKDDVFRDCYSLVSITIPAKSTISYNAFRGNGIGAFNFSITDPEPYSISIGEEEILPINTFLSKYLRDTPQIKEKNGETGFLESAEGKIEKVNGQEVYKVGVKGIKEGTTQVSVVGTSNYLLYDSTVLTKAPEVTITLNVTKQKCTGIEDKRSSVVMGIDNGAGVTVNPQVLPADCSESNEWSSSNESIVSVIPKTYIQSGVEVASSSAVLMPKSFGTSKVTLKTGSVKKDYQVNVVVPATGITLDQQELSTKEGSKDRIKLNATMTYDTAKYSTTDWENHKDVLDYQSSDEKIVTVSPEGVVTPVKAGTATITVTALGGGKTAVCKVRVLPDETVVFLTDATGTVWDTEKTVSVQAKEPIVLNIATENRWILWQNLLGNFQIRLCSVM